MKKVLFLILFSQLISCEKESFIADNENSASISCSDSSICHLVIQGKPDINRLSEPYLDTIKVLFSNNNLSLNNLFFNFFLKDDLGYSHIGCLQYIHNLNVISNELLFHFDSHGHFTGLSGEIVSDIKVPSIPSLCIGQVIHLFLQSVEKDGFYINNLQKIKDGCISCELGYWDLNAGTSYAQQNFTLAWRVKPINSDYPFALINDSKKSLIFFDDGIRTSSPLFKIPKPNTDGRIHKLVTVFADSLLLP